ncbi:hypothetical protein [Maribacter sp. 2308TA10-17]|uniref:hypothetical protein n=1 Tax=Maribacter sp. 2308TA10-17 TaxID=3386276 RepID=UPI0039BC388B
MKENKELDDFIRKSVKEAGLEQPSDGFTNAVFEKIGLEVQKSSVLTSEPLFSKTTWFMLISAVTGIFAYVILGSSASIENTWMAAIKLNKLTSFNLSLNMSELPFSTTFIYGCSGVAFFVWIQVILIKQRLNKRYAES